MRGELLNETLFFGLDHARSTVAGWVADHNAARPHSALGYQTPTALRKQAVTAQSSVIQDFCGLRSPLARSETALAR